MHRANHPTTEHYTEDVWKVDPVEACAGRPVALAWFSPDCKHHSKAKGGKPVEEVLKDFGITATVDELKAFVNANAAEGKLDKAQLDEVAGGTTPTIATVVPAAGVTISVSSAATC